MKTTIVALLLASIVSPAFAGDKTADTADRQILGVLVALNKNEIAAGDFVGSRKVDPAVKKYAHQMVKDHTENLHQTLGFTHKVGQPLASDDSKTLQKDGKEELDALKKLKGKELATTYIDNMVKDHEAALQTIDDNLLKNVDCKN